MYFILSATVVKTVKDDSSDEDVLAESSVASKSHLVHHLVQLSQNYLSHYLFAACVNEEYNI